MHHIKHNSGLPRAEKKSSRHSEQGIALLGTTVVLALVMGLLVWGTLVMTRQSAISAYQVNNTNQARTAALIGISALEQYAQQSYAPTTSTASATGNSNSNPFASFISGFLTNNTQPLPTSGPGAIAAYVPVGTNAATSITFSAPYMAATVSAVVTANTFSVSPSPNGTPGQLIIASQGASGSARDTAIAVLGIKTVNTTPQAIQNKITLSGNAILDGNQFKGASIGVTSGSTIQNSENSPPTSITGQAGTKYSIGSLKNITVVSSIPAVYPDGFKSYASIQLLYNNGNPEMVIPQTASYIEKMYGVAPGTYSYCTNNYFGCYGSAANAAKSAFSTLGISYTSGGSINKGVWTLSSPWGSPSTKDPLTAFIYSDGDVSLNFTGTAYISVAADGVVSTGATNGKGSSSNDLYPFAQYSDVCSLFGNVCQQGQPIPDLEGFSISSNNGINLIHGTTIEGSIGSNGTIAYNGGGSITINGAIVASGLKVSGGSSLNVQGATKGSGLSSPNNISTFSGGQQLIFLQSLYWKQNMNISLIKLIFDMILKAKSAIQRC